MMREINKKNKKDIEICGKMDIYENEYWAITDKITVDIEIGEMRKNLQMRDDELMEKFRSKYELEQECQIIFTDGSVQQGKKSTGVRIVIDETETAYSIDKYR